MKLDNDYTSTNQIFTMVDESSCFFSAWFIIHTYMHKYTKLATALPVKCYRVGE